MDKPKRTNRRTRKQRTAEYEEIVSLIRKLLVADVTRGDIKKMVKLKFPHRFGSPRSVEPYIAEAQKQIREMGELTDVDSLAASLSYWAVKKQTAENRLAKAQAAAEEAGTQIRAADIACEEADSREEYSLAMERKKLALRAADDARRTSYSENQNSMNAQQQIDRLRGNHAPTKIAQTTKTGRDVHRPADEPEPVDVDKALDELLSKYESRSSTIPPASSN